MTFNDSTVPGPAGANRIVGGLFGQECSLCSAGKPPCFLTGRELFLVNARSGIWLLIHRLKPSQVWIPSYLCQTILWAIDPGVTLRFYEMDYDLRAKSGQWVSEVNAGDLVIFIDYFGFPYDRELGARIKERGAWVLEDASQSLLSAQVGLLSDFVVYSIRKWIGVPDGGILRYPETFPLEDVPLTPPPVAWWMKAFRARILRRQFDEGHPTRDWFRLFRETEDTAPVGPYAMSQLSRNVLECCADYSTIGRSRIENYRRLSAGLTHYALFPMLEEGVVPLGFPVRIRRRDEVLQALFQSEIYPPVHWRIEGVVPPRYEESHRLASQIMTIPCDQRYAEDDMERIMRIFLQHAGHPAW